MIDVGIGVGAAEGFVFDGAKCIEVAGSAWAVLSPPHII